MPSHGVYRRYSTSPLLATLIIKTEGGENYFAKLVSITDNTPAAEFFIEGGRTLVASVPLGTFTLKYADGIVWCGESELFGPDTLLQETNKTFEFSDGDQWTIELIRQRGGNLTTKYIPRGNF
jgi:hypothetical protein